jgi:hypothetical protein
LPTPCSTKASSKLKKKRLAGCLWVPVNHMTSFPLGVREFFIQPGKRDQ